MGQDGAWKLFGIEPSAQAAQRAVQETGAEVFCGSLEDAQFPAASFDVITMWHVMEHLYNPRAALGNLRRMLKSNGMLVLAVPILDSVDAKWFGPYWSGYDVPRHLFTYSMATLSEMLGTCGFTAVHMESFIGGYDAFRISLNFWAGESIKSPRLLNLVQSCSQSVGFRLLMMPYFAVINLLGRGSTLVATASLVPG
jgi:predicted SAM-dependent methyltransferase